MAIKPSKPVVKVNSNPNPTPAKGNKEASWDAHEYRALYQSEVVDPHYGIDRERTGPDVIQIHSGGHLGGAHMGGHSDVAAAIRLGGLTMKTPIMKPTSTKQKTPVAKPSSTKNK